MNTETTEWNLQKSLALDDYSGSFQEINNRNYEHVDQTKLKLPII